MLQAAWLFLCCRSLLTANACKQSLQVADRVDVVLCDLASALLPPAEGRVDLLVRVPAFSAVPLVCLLFHVLRF